MELIYRFAHGASCAGFEPLLGLTKTLREKCSAVGRNGARVAKQQQRRSVCIMHLGRQRAGGTSSAVTASLLRLAHAAAMIV